MSIPHNPDIRRKLKDRLLDLSPRAFEYFAGDLLTYIGLQNTAVTRYVGDGGIDAQGDIIASSGFVRIQAGVQVKRLRQNVQRPDIDRFIGALGGQFEHGIFITTADYAQQAQVKARSSPLLRVSLLNGDQVVKLMYDHQLGTTLAAGPANQLDEDFFLAFEARASNRPPMVATPQVEYQLGEAPNAEAVHPAEDLISMRTLGYQLRIDPYTVQDWVRSGKILADSTVTLGQRESYFFRRDRIEVIRSQLNLQHTPTSAEEWRQAFLDFNREVRLTRSYKPVFLRALLASVDRNGAANIDDVTRAFHAFYLQRQRKGLPTELDGDLSDPSQATPDEIKKLLIKYPLDRFILKHFLSYDKQASVIRFAPQLWLELRYYELVEIQQQIERQLDHYYERLQRKQTPPG
ncbi:MAG: restriction endonuclease [Oscillochloridaceae bacterium umkhey_bin13]